MYASEMTPADIRACTGGNEDGFGFGGNGAWWIIILLLFGWGRGGYGGIGGGGGAPCATQADLAAGFNNSAVLAGINGIDSTLCQGFNGVNTAILQGVNGLERQISDCCCGTQRAIDGVNFNLAKGFCDIGNVIQSTTRDVIDNQNANYRGIMDFMVSEKLASKDAKIAELTNQLSLSNQNAVLGARIDAAVAEILRRTGNDCPTAAYLVQPPTPVNFPVNGCGTVQFGGCNGAFTA